MNTPPPNLFGNDLIGHALSEDIGPGDVTSENFLPAAGRSAARIFPKQPAVALAGASIARDVFLRVDPSLDVDLLLPDGTPLEPGQTVLAIRGATRSILTAERVALNFLQHLSGIATITRRFVEAVGPHPARILDTRKTIPGLRREAKDAVRAGGGTNHRTGLYDMVMVKDNHLAACPDPATLARRIEAVRAAHPGMRVEVEADTLEQVRGFLGIAGIDVILLDNMTCAAMAEAVRMGAGRVRFEASGNVTLERVPEIAATGVDFISVGTLTHSAPAVDFSLEITGLP